MQQPQGHVVRGLSTQHRRALRMLLPVLQAQNVRYQITGGLAGNLYGSTWPLHDIDLDVVGADIPRLLSALTAIGAELTRPLSRLVDDEFDLELATVALAGVDVDISQVEDAYVFHRGTRAPLITDLDRATTRTIEDLTVYVQPLDDLIAYKELLGRHHDLIDLYRLRPSGPPG
jgi:hypothetical protein